MQSNKIKIYSLSITLVVLVLCQIPLFAVINGDGLKILEDEGKNIFLHEVEEELRQSDQVAGDQKITLIKGGNDPSVEDGISTLITSLSDEIEVIKHSSLNVSNVAEILVIFSHGTEEGIILDGNLISWYNLAIFINQTKAKNIYLATCFGANIHNFTKGTTNTIIALKGLSDAIIMSYVIACHINIKYLHPDEALSNIDSLEQRVKVIYDHPEEFLALAWWKIERKNIPFILVSHTLHLKFTPLEAAGISLVDAIICLLSAVFNLILIITGWNPAALVAILAALLLESALIWIAFCVSIYHFVAHPVPNIGAWISFESPLWPPVDTWIQARGGGGQVLTTFPSYLGPALTVVFYWILSATYDLNPASRSWVWIDLPI